MRSALAALLLAGAAAAQGPAAPAPASGDTGFTLRGTLDANAWAVNQDETGFPGTAEQQGLNAIGKLRLRYRTVTEGGIEIQVRAEARASALDFFRYPLIDEAFAVDRLFVSAEAGWGRVELGLREGLGVQFLGLPPAVTRSMRIDGGQSFALTDGLDEPYAPGGLILNSNLNATDRAAKALYMTPRLFGLQAGVSFTPDRSALLGNAFSRRPGALDRQRHVWELGLNYDSVFDNVRLRGGLVYLTAEVDNASDTAVTAQSPWVSAGMEEWGASLSAQISLGEGQSLRVGGAMRLSNVQGGFTDENPVVLSDGSASEIWSLGAVFASGGWSLGAGYARGETDVAVTGLGLAPGRIERQTGEAWELAAGYAITPDIQLSLGYQDYGFDASAGLNPLGLARAAPAGLGSGYAGDLSGEIVYTEFSLSF
jgi:predicted porin